MTNDELLLWSGFILFLYGWMCYFQSHPIRKKIEREKIKLYKPNEEAFRKMRKRDLKK